MGYVCPGRLLHQNQPFFATRSADAGNCVVAPAGGRGINGNFEEAKEEEEEEDADLEDECGPIANSDKKKFESMPEPKNSRYLSNFIISSFFIFFWLKKYVKFIQVTVVLSFN